MENPIENAVKEFLKSSSEEEKKGAKKALDIVSLSAFQSVLLKKLA